MAAIDTLSNTVIATIPIGQAPQAVNYVPGAVPAGDGRQGFSRWGLPGKSRTSCWRRQAPPPPPPRPASAYSTKA